GRFKRLSTKEMILSQDAFRPIPWGQVTIDPGILRQRADLNRAYMLSLKSENLLQNHYMEAGLWGPRLQPNGCHWGWESPPANSAATFSATGSPPPPSDSPPPVTRKSGGKPTISCPNWPVASERTAVSGSGRSPSTTSTGSPGGRKSGLPTTLCTRR